MTMLNQTDIEGLVQRIVTRLSPKKIVLFGTYAKGTPSVGGDVTLLVITDTDVPLARRADWITSLANTSTVRIDIQVYTPEEVREYRRDPDSFISSILRSGRTLFGAQEMPDIEIGQDIVAENIKAAGVIHYSAMLEEMRAFDVVDRIMEMYANGRLPIGQSEAGDALYAYRNNSPNRMTEAERRTLYARVLGVPDSNAEVPPNTEFTALWQRFVAAVSALNRQRAFDPVSAHGRLNQEHIRRAGQDLAVNLSLHGWGMAAAAARLRTEIDAMWHVLSNADLQQAFAARTVWQLIERVSRDLGGASPGARRPVFAHAGVVIFAWLASRASVLARGSGDVLHVPDIRDKRSATDPTTTPTDYDLVNACEQWLADVALGDESIETDAVPERSHVGAAVASFLASTASFRELTPARQQQVARDTVTIVEYLAERGGGAANELIREVDFPDFVAGLIQGTFTAIVDSSVQQMEAYGDLMASVASSLGKFRDALTEHDAATQLWKCHLAFGRRQQSANSPSASGAVDPSARPRSERQQLLVRTLMLGIKRVVGSGD
jgi:predicted nucleotidyltransferase